MSRIFISVILGLSLSSCFGFGTKKQPKQEIVTTAPPVIEKKQEEKKVIRNIEFTKKVHFAFDSSELTESSAEALLENVAWLKDRGFKSIVLQGHCDERGTREYNLALGDKRASAVKRFLVRNGVSNSSIKTVSYGEERPAVIGSNESAWKQNRRVEFLVD